MQPPREPLDAIVGLVLGTLWGAGLGLGACLWILPQTLLFPGDTMIAGAVVFAGLGYWKGDRFFRWLRDEWPW